MLMRLLLLVGLIGLAYFLIKRFLTATTSSTRKNPESFQTMVQCAHCGLHIPKPEAVTQGADEFYCSSAHAKLGQSE